MTKSTTKTNKYLTCKKRNQQYLSWGKATEAEEDLPLPCGPNESGVSFFVGVVDGYTKLDQSRHYGHVTWQKR
jgi:hypothetical protein